ncbi:MAG: hypothetical protein OXF63_02105, partial [Anaerolineaceae bacterium]|nr:hypothetical protein [Anaerolineaceae bacterium]
LAAHSTQHTATTTITDKSSDTVAVRLHQPASPFGGTVYEPAAAGVRSVEFVLDLTRALAAGERVDVPLAVSGAGVVPLADYTLTVKPGSTGVSMSGTNTLAPVVSFRGAGAQTATLVLTAVDDRFAEDTETVSVAMGDAAAFKAQAGTNVDKVAPATSAKFSTPVSVRIVDASATPVVSVTGPSGPMFEGERVGFVVSATSNRSGPVEVAVSVAQTGGYVPATVDGVKQLGTRKVTVPTGVSSVRLWVPTESKLGAVADGSVSVAVQPGPYVLADAVSARAAVRRTVGVAITASASSVAEKGGTAEVTVTLQHPVAADGELVVPLAVAGATVGDDFTVALDTTKSDSGVTLATTGSRSTQSPGLRFGPGADSAVLDFTAVDNKDRSQPYVSVGLDTVPPRGPIRPTAAQAGFAITDDETGALVVPADWPLLPHGAEPGDSFRLLFVTSGKRDAQASAIDAYDGFVRSAAARGGHAALRPFGGLVSVVGSTASSDARAHTGMWSGSAWADAGGAVPVVWLAERPAADETVADSYADFFSTTAEWALQNQSRDEAGRTVKPDAAGYFTGTNRDGTKRVGNALGQTRPGVGVLNNAAAGRTPLFDSTAAGTVAKAERRSFYALSPVFTVAASAGEPADAVFAAVPDDLALAENANGSTTAIAVGSPVVASDANGDEITYGLEGVRPAGWPGAAPKPPAGFAIDAGSGQLSYTGTGVDREKIPGGEVAMVVTATSTGASGSAVTVRQPVSVTVTDVDEGDAGVVLAGAAVAGRSTLKLDGVSGDPDGDPATAGLTLQWQASSAKSGPWAAA